MSIISELGRKMADAGSNVADSAKKLADAAKMSDLVQEKEQAVEQLFKEIGFRYFQEMKDEEGEFLLHELVANAKKRVEEIEHRTAQLNALRGKKECAKCGQALSVDSTFCSECGTPVAQVAEEPKSKFCMECGNQLDPNAKFCLICGKKVG